MTFLPSYSQVVFTHSLGFSFDRDPRGVVWHCTEGSSVAGAVSVYKRFPACPHLTVDFDTKQKVQHVPLDSAAYALRNLSGGCETNSTGVIQIEVVGYSADTWSWSPERLRWLGEEVLWPILEACPTIPRGPVYSGQRMTCPEWDVWSGGQCGHRDVPENDHTDPGDLDLKRIVDYATGDTVTPEDIEAIAQRTHILIWERMLDVKIPDGTRIESHAAIDVLGYAYEMARRTAYGVERLSNVAITTEEP